MEEEKQEEEDKGKMEETAMRATIMESLYACPGQGRPGPRKEEGRKKGVHPVQAPKAESLKKCYYC